MSIAYNTAPQNACEKVFSDRYLFRNILSFISEFHIRIINTKERACPKSHGLIIVLKVGIYLKYVK